MTKLINDHSESLSPLESFVRDYVDVTGGVWEQVEPQVYDLLLPSDPTAADTGTDGREILRVTFDPEAVSEHPGSQLASFGTPLIDRLLTSAVEQGRFARAYVNGLNLVSHGLQNRIRRAISLPEPLQIEIARTRSLNFPQAVFWFSATFVSDQKEDEILPVAMDLHYSRQVRHLDKLLDEQRLAAEPAMLLPEAQHCSLAEAYPMARERVVRTLATLVNTRRRELNERVERQIARMTRYYADVSSELTEQQSRARDRDAGLEKYKTRREAIDREQRLRITELRQKSTLHVQLRLVSVLLIQQPKLRIESKLTSKRPPIPLELIWDPLTEMVEAVPCPNCLTPTLIFKLDRLSHLACPSCTAARGSK
jgi:hypothetical protein